MMMMIMMTGSVDTHYYTRSRAWKLKTLQILDAVRAAAGRKHSSTVYVRIKGLINT